MFGSAGGNDFATAFAGFGTEVDEMVGLTKYIEIVLDDNDGVASRNKALEHVHQHLDVFEMETCGWFVKDV